MGLFDLFSKRQKKLRGDVPDVFTYNLIPKQLKVQIIYIINDSIGVCKNSSYDRTQEIYETIFNILCREYGKFKLIEDGRHHTYKQQVLEYFLLTKNVDEDLDVVELLFKCLEILKNDYESYCMFTDVKITPDEAINELNERFKEHAIGFSFEEGEIFKIDSTYIHTNIVKPTLTLLHSKKFAGANDEYLKAHEHYRHGRNKECLAECLKSFESTMKIICKEKGWTYNQTDTAKKLILICFQNQLVPSFTQNQFTSLQNLLESGIPTIRNKLGGHGQGQQPQKVDDEMTRYGLNLTGTNIIFLVEQSGV